LYVGNLALSANRRYPTLTPPLGFVVVARVVVNIAKQAQYFHLLLVSDVLHPHRYLHSLLGFEHINSGRDFNSLVVDYDTGYHFYT
jgi:hypothetical protein